MLISQVHKYLSTSAVDNTTDKLGATDKITYRSSHYYGRLKNIQTGKSPRYFSGTTGLPLGQESRYWQQMSHERSWPTH